MKSTDETDHTALTTNAGRAVPTKRRRTPAVSTGSAARKKTPQARGPRKGTKTTKILALLKRSEGAGLKELMKATRWQAHSVRGFLSGVLTKKMGLKLRSEKVASGERRYSVVA